MYKHRSRRYEIWRLISLLVFIPVIVGILLTASVMYMVGYRLDIGKHTVAQGGLIQFDSHPRGASIFIDSKELADKTATKSDESAGTHTVRMELKGYYPWQKTVSMDPGKILWLNYARLIPLSIATSVEASYQHVDQALAVHGTSTIFVLPNKTIPTIYIVRTANTNFEQTKLKLPAALATKPQKTSKSAYTIVASDATARYLLLRHDYDKTSEYIYVDTTNVGQSVNLTSTIGTQVDDIQFDTANGRRLYVLSDGNLSRVDTTNLAAPTKLLSSVAEISLDATGNVGYVTQLNTTSNSRAVGYISKGSNEPRAIRTFYGSTKVPLHFREYRYFDSNYFALQYGESLEISTGSLPSSDSSSPVLLSNVATISLTDSASVTSFSPSGRFVMISFDDAFMTYDLELNKLSNAVQRGDGAASPLEWLDQTSLVSTRGGQLQYYEYDGENSHKLLDGVMAGSSVYSPDSNAIYCLQTASDGAARLIRIDLKV